MTVPPDMSLVTGSLMPKECLKLADVRTNILRSAEYHWIMHGPCLPSHRTITQSFQNIYQVIATLNIHVGMCCMSTVWESNLWSVGCKQPWMLQQCDTHTYMLDNSLGSWQRKNFSLCCHIQTSSGSHESSYCVTTLSTFLLGKTPGQCS
jgi:hypothetical protein